jgi:cyanate permease
MSTTDPLARTFREVEGELIERWSLSAFTLFASVGIYSLLHEQEALRVPHGARRFISVALLIVSFILAVVALTLYVQQHWDKDVLANDRKSVDRVAMWAQIGTMGLYMMLQIMLIYYVVYNSYTNLEPRIDGERTHLRG